MSEEKSVLFVCLGNICRSPIAEAVFLHTIKDRGRLDHWNVDSAAIGSRHIGKAPDHRAILTLKKHNIQYNKKFRQITKEDFTKYDYILGMDHKNITDLQNLRSSNGTAKIMLLGEFDAQGERIITDPYFDQGAEGFKRCYEQCVRCVNGFLKEVDL